MFTIYILIAVYIMTFVYLVSKKDFGLTLFLLIYTGPVTAVILHLLFPETYLMGGGRVYLQTQENTFQLLVIALIGLMGLALSYSYPSRLRLFQSERFELKLSRVEIIFWLFVAFVLIYYIMPSVKIWHAEYLYSKAQQQEIPGIKVGRVIGHSIFLVIFVSVLRYKLPYRYYVLTFILFSVIYLEILSGVRSEAIGLAVAMLAYIVNDDNFLNVTSKVKRLLERRKAKLNRRVYFFLALIVALIYYIGKTRSGGAVDFKNFSTFEAVAATYLSAVQLIEQGYTDYFYGKTYFDIILQTLPASINPDRPLVPAQYILHTPLAASGGAFLAGTAYMNFSYFGPFIILFIIGRIMQVTKNGMQSGGFLSVVIYLSFVMSFFRLMYYSELATYKMILVTLIAFFMMWSVSSLLKLALMNKA